MSKISTPDLPPLHLDNTHNKLTQREIDNFINLLRPYLNDIRPSRSELMAILTAFYHLIESIIPEGGSGSGDVQGVTTATINDVAVYANSDGKSIKSTSIPIGTLVPNYTNLNNNGSVGNGAAQVAAGNHEHTNYLTNDGYDGAFDVLGTMGTITITVDKGKIIDVTTS